MHSLKSSSSSYEESKLINKSINLLERCQKDSKLSKDNYIFLFVEWYDLENAGISDAMRDFCDQNEGFTNLKHRLNWDIND